MFYIHINVCPGHSDKRLRQNTFLTPFVIVVLCQSSSVTCRNIIVLFSYGTTREVS